MKRPDLIQSSATLTTNNWQTDTPQKTPPRQFLSENDRLRAANEDLRKKIAAHLTSLNKKN